MNRYVSTSMPVLPDVDKMGKVRRKYREALLYIGKSPDYHIFDLSEEYIASLRDSKAKRFLLKIKRYVASLSYPDAQIFVIDVLERGRHYPFWYLENYTRRIYEQRLRNVVAEVPPCLGR